MARSPDNSENLTNRDLNRALARAAKAGDQVTMRKIYGLMGIPESSLPANLLGGLPAAATTVTETPNIPAQNNSNTVAVGTMSPADTQSNADYNVFQDYSAQYKAQAAAEAAANRALYDRLAPATNNSLRMPKVPDLSERNPYIGMTSPSLNQINLDATAAAKKAIEFQMASIRTSADLQAKSYEFQAQQTRQDRFNYDNYLSNAIRGMSNQLFNQVGQTRQQAAVAGLTNTGSVSQVLSDMTAQGSATINSAFVSGRQQMDQMANQELFTSYTATQLRKAGEVQAQATGLLADIQLHKY